MIVMLLWAGSYKMTAPGAEGIVPLVSNSPLISWHFKLFGPYIGSDLIGLTEIMAALLMIAGYFRPKAGIIGGLIASGMFGITSTMVITTPGAIVSCSWDEVYEFSGPVPFQGCHIPRGILLPGQLFRSKSDPFRKQSPVTKADRDHLRWVLGPTLRGWCLFCKTRSRFLHGRTRRLSQREPVSDRRRSQNPSLTNESVPTPPKWIVLKKKPLADFSLCLGTLLGLAICLLQRVVTSNEQTVPSADATIPLVLFSVFRRALCSSATRCLPHRGSRDV